MGRIKSLTGQVWPPGRSLPSPVLAGDVVPLHLQLVAGGQSLCCSPHPHLVQEEMGLDLGDTLLAKATAVAPMLHRRQPPLTHDCALCVCAVVVGGATGRASLGGAGSRMCVAFSR